MNIFKYDYPVNKIEDIKKIKLYENKRYFKSISNIIDEKKQKVDWVDGKW